MGIAFATIAVLCALAEPDTSYAFFSQSTVASHDENYKHGLPSMARLSDDRILVVWTRFPSDGSEDMAILGSFSSDAGCTWSQPQLLIDHPKLLDADPSVVVSGSRVLVTCTTATFAEGIRESSTWAVRSEDDGKTWSEPYVIPMNHKYTCGKCHRGLRLKSGTLLQGYSWDILCESGTSHSSEGQMDLRAGVMRSTDDGLTWTNGGDTTAEYVKVAEGAVHGTDEPAIVELEDGSIYMLMRTGADHLFEARSTDEGLTWSDVRPSPLTGSNAPAALSSFVAEHGRRGVFVVWDNALTRHPLCAAASFDGCKTWTTPKDIAAPYEGDMQNSYPSCVQAADGALLAVWQRDVPGGRNVVLARFSSAWLLQDVESSASNVPAVVLFGDSTTAPRGPLNTFGKLLAAELPKAAVRANVVNAGIPGDTTVQARARFESDVLAKNPAVVTISFGINDSAIDVWDGASAPRISLEEFEANLVYFVQTLKARGAKPILMTPNPLAWTAQLRGLYGKPPYFPDDPEGFNVTLEQYVPVIRKVAQAENVPLIDIYTLFKERRAEHPEQPLLLDGMHPNDWGHRLIADQLISVIPAMLPMAKP
ncbi:MAG: exo-alpha-sialidase [Candidatus Hydrogenedentes bacterium]|nr:exo-alpha-sialidase [Candidatus Hydrogenedentota bacterium]